MVFDVDLARVRKSRIVRDVGIDIDLHVLTTRSPEGSAACAGGEVNLIVSLIVKGVTIYTIEPDRAQRGKMRYHTVHELGLVILDRVLGHDKG